MNGKEKSRCGLCGIRTPFPIAHYLDFHYRKRD